MRQKDYGLTLALEGPDGFHVFRAEFNEDHALRVGEGLEDFRDGDFTYMAAALLFATNGWPQC